MKKKNFEESNSPDNSQIGKHQSQKYIKPSQDLKSRLYDKGFNQQTMPSVKRPEAAKSQQKILTAKLTNFQKRQQKNEPIIYQPQSVVLHKRENTLPLLKGRKTIEQEQFQTIQHHNIPDDQEFQSSNIYNNTGLQQTKRAQTSNRVRSLTQKHQTSTQLPVQQAKQRIESAINQQLSQGNQTTQINKESSKPSTAQNQRSKAPMNVQDRIDRIQSVNIDQTHNNDHLHSQINKAGQNQRVQSGKRPQQPISAKTHYQGFGHQIPEITDRQQDNRSNLTGSRVLYQQEFEQDTIHQSAKFQDKEIQRTKYLIDKLSGKFNIDRRYLNTGKTGQLESHDDIIEEHSGNEDENQGIKADQHLLTNYKRPASKLDKYIDLILKNVTNVNEFIYLKRNNEDDPYDLQVVDYKKIQDDENKNDLKEYYTISRKGLCHYIGCKPVEFIQLAYWLKERQTYDQIKSLQFFTKFRKWKTLKMWKKNVIRHKNQNCARLLQEKLFILNPIMRTTILQYRSNTFDMMQTLRFIGISDKDAFSGSETCFTLKQFKANQEETRKQINQKIQGYSGKCREIVTMGFEESLNLLRKNQYMANTEEEQQQGAQQKKGNQNFFRLKESAYEALGFSDNMTYEKRSELRKECSKFLRFAYLVDFLAMEALSNIFVYSVQELEDRLHKLMKEDGQFIVRDINQKGMSLSAYEPMFQIALQPQLNMDAITPDDYSTELIKEFIPHPMGTSQPEDFNILYHIRLKKSKEEKVKVEKDQKDPKKKNQQQQDSDSEDPELNEESVYQRTIVPDITNIWLKTYPDKELFFKDLMKCIAEGGSSIQAFERWSRHEDMRKYVFVLEEWDDIVGEDWENAASNYLNPSEWLDSSPNEMFQDGFKKLIDKAFDQVDKFIKQNFYQFLIQYWEAQKLDFEIFKNEHLSNAGDAYYYALKMLNFQKDFFEKQIPFTADLGLIRLDSSELRKLIVNEPDKKLKEFQNFVPGMLKQRNDEISTWMVNQAQLLKGNAPNIDEFVKRSNILKDTIKLLPRYKRKFYDMEHIRNIFVEFKFELKPDKSSNVETGQDLKRLENIIFQAEEQSERNLERYARDVTTKLIPELEREAHELDSKVNDKKYISEELELSVAIKELTELNEICKALDERSKNYNHYEKTLNLPFSRFEDLEITKLDVTLRYQMWTSIKEWQDLTKMWIDGKFTDINVVVIKQRAEYYTKIVNKCVKNMPQNPILEKLKKMVFDFKDTMPVVVALRNKDLHDYHWDEIKKIIGREFTITEDFTLKDLIDMDVVKYVTEIQEVATQATQEAVLKQMYDDLNLKWRQLQFVTAEKEGKSKDVVLLSQIDELFALLDELLANLNNILGSRYLKTMRDKVDELQKKVLYSQETIDDMLLVQKNWIYLENIFKSTEIKQKLKEETSQFEKVDTFFKKQMNFIKKNIYVYKCIQPNSKKDWNRQKETLSSIQQALDNLLEEKRSAFPRFYFLSNDELLEILAKSNDMEAIQKNMKKCFDAVHRLVLSEGNSKLIQGMSSPEGEQILFQKQIPPKGDPEGWLMQFQEIMKETIQKRMKKGKQDFEQTTKERHEWTLDHPAQIVATIAQIMWTQYTEHFINIQNDEKSDQQNGLSDWANLNHLQVEQLTKLITKGLPDLQHKSIIALITQDVHARDIIDNLNEEGITHINDFLWQKQLRYYWDEDMDTIIVKQVNAQIKYGYEYMGATSRLVITPLTDRCWMTITGALNIQLGAAPAGPAGTGKTESTKDLGKSLGMLCVVFNCSDQIEYKMMGRLFSGLAEQGAWSCLDEFNRIDIEVLSVIAQQLSTIRQALVKKDLRFQFADKEISLKADGYGVFVTMNPGYAGRTELPDNLKVLFRPVAMMIPDYGMIAEIMLYSEGFENAQSLSKKMVQLYKLSSEQLSQQDHYDFGMRAVKSVLNMAGFLKRAQPDMNEDVLLIRAMIDSNVPKFLKEDLPLFSALIQDLFPVVQIPDPDYGLLKQQIEESTLNLHYQLVPQLTNKVIQLFETFNVRFGVMLVGQTTSGKTTCYKILADAMSEIKKKGTSTDKRYQKVNIQVMNPKCIAMGELYGEVNPFTYEWNDGLASSIMREAAYRDDDEKVWVVCDGPVDSLWIENMNTVLDDNMMLCLANGQRIKLRPQMRMLFEVQDLKVASPATVSRCGMVYLMYEDLGWRPYVYSWIQDRFAEKQKKERVTVISDNEEHKGDHKYVETIIKQEEILSPELRLFLINMFEQSVDIAINRIRTKFKELIQTVDLQLVSSLCNLLDCFISEQFGFKPKDKPEDIRRFLAHSFAFAFIWSIGASVSDQYHDYINDMVRDLFQSIIFPNQDTVYGFYLDVQNDLMFKHWNDKVETFVYDKDIPYFNLLVPTIDTCRYRYIVEQLLSFKKHVYVTGPSGTGKSVVIESLLESVKEPRSMDSFQLIFSAQTNSHVIQLAIEDKLKKKSKNELGAISGHQNIIFIDDINMPSVEVFGAQPPIELLRLLIDKGFLWDRKERFLKYITDTTLVCCSAPPGGGRSSLTPRFTRHFNLLCFPQPNHKILHKIFQSLLQGFFDVLGFQPSVKQYVDSIVNGTIEAYQRIQAEKLPIPSKFHYTFNLRDVSKVFQGIMMSQPQVIRDDQSISRLWIHELSRVFHDRLINEQDRDWFYDMGVELLTRHFKGNFEKKELFIDKQIMFSDILRIDVGNREYEEIVDMKKLLKCLDDKLDDYNTSDANQSKMHLVFFDMCIEHLLKILRILRQMRGNAMLIGVGGSGKQSLTRLASSVLDFKNEQIEIKKDYNLESFREFIQDNLMKVAGVQGKGVTFIFTDTQILKESFLEDINNILNSGEVPNMWKPEDKDSVLNDIKDINTKAKKPTDPDTCYKTFVERVRNNLHIVLCMSPVGDALRIRCRQFPSLVDCCTLDWFTSWPEEALLNVANKLLRNDTNFPQAQTVDQEALLTNISIMCKDVHITSLAQAEKFESQLRRKVYNTPKSYLDLIKLYQQLLKEKRDEFMKNQKRLSGGLKKLDQANKQIAHLQITLTELKPQLEQQNIAVATALIQVEKDTIIAQEKESIVSEETEKVQKQKDKIQLITDEAQSELDKVMPDLIKAQEAVEKIDRNQLVNLRSMPNPPQVVLMVFEGVCALLGHKSDWASVKGTLIDLNKFVQSLVNYDKDNISSKSIKKLNAVLAKPEFDIPLIASKVSYAADLAQFCKAMKIYSDTNEKVKPKKEQVFKLSQELDIANSALKKQLDALNAVKSNVQRLREETNKMEKKKDELQTEMELTEARLERAKKLISLTGDESQRWEITSKVIMDEIECLFGDVFLSAAQISYNGPFTGVYRKELINQWMDAIKEIKIPRSENYSIIKNLGDPMILREWVIQGLPSDTVSQESSIFVKKSFRWPLLIDPQLQATKWLKNMESAELTSLKLQGNWIRSLQSIIQNGYACLIEDVDETLDPGLDSILSKAIYESEGSLMIRFGEQDLLYHKDFRLYMTTKKPNPQYLPEIFIKVTVINFTATFEGLEDQLLADVVKNERPQVEQQKDENIKNLAKFKKRIELSEKNILQLLEDAKAETILDDVTLISTLETSKETAIEIKEKLQESEILEKEINEIRNSYRKVSIRGSILYFVIKDLSLIDPMYQYSLQYIQKLFIQAMSITPKSEIHEERLENLIDQITKTIFTNVCRGLFEKDKLLFSFLISTSINKNSGILSEQLWSILLRGAGIFDKSKQPPNPNKDIISAIAWDLAYYLDTSFDRFKGLTKHITTKFNLWKEYAQSPDPLDAKLPEDWSKTGIFEKMLILKIFRPEKILFCVSRYVQHYLGQFYLDPPPAIMEKIHADSDVSTPIIFVLSQGADPTATVLNFAKQRGMEDNLKSISLGQGQGDKAAQLIEDGKVNGNWVFLQNCHLMRTWMPSLENIISKIREGDHTTINPNFRIFLTSMPDNSFPISVLQNGIKLTTEPPRGLKANLKRSWANIEQSFLDSCAKQELKPVFHKLVWGLTYFHAIIQERRKFGPLGWNIRYEFNDSDLNTSSTVMKMLLEDQEQIPWDSMLFVSGHINYGGRVTDDWDRRCLITLLKKFYTTSILEDKYQFSDSHIYMIPGLGTIENYRENIEQLPLHEDPAVFGLNENANIIYQYQESSNLITTILSIQPKTTGSASGKSNDQIINELVETIQGQMPNLLLKEDGHKELFEQNDQGLIQSLSTVLLQEMARFNKLLTMIKTSLKNLKLAIDGFMVMSSDLDSCYYNLLNNQVPTIWEKVAYPSLKPLASWILDLIERVKFMHIWLTQNHPPCYWLSGFFFPQGFMTGVLQTHSRKYKTAIDQLEFSFKITDLDKEICTLKPTDGVYIYGLFLEGAVWDRKKKTLQDATQGQTHQEMPVIYFNPVENYDKKEENYSCPAYKTSKRAGVLSTTGQSTNFILAVDIPSLEHTTDFWTLRGTALLCQLND